MFGEDQPKIGICPIYKMIGASLATSQIIFDNANGVLLPNSKIIYRAELKMLDCDSSTTVPNVFLCVHYASSGAIANASCRPGAVRNLL